MPEIDVTVFLTPGEDIRVNDEYFDPAIEAWIPITIDTFRNLGTDHIVVTEALKVRRWEPVEG